jgi:hypothetical protein
MITTVRIAGVPASIASNATAAASPPGFPPTNSDPALCPETQLVDRAGSERVTRRHHHPLLLGTEASGELADDVVFPARSHRCTTMIIGLSAGTNKVGSL